MYSIYYYAIRQESREIHNIEEMIELCKTFLYSGVKNGWQCCYIDSMALQGGELVRFTFMPTRTPQHPLVCIFPVHT